MNTKQIIALLIYSLGMSVGQMLFKKTSLTTVHQPEAGKAWQVITPLVFNPYFMSAFVLYIALTCVWVWILTFTPLSRAYPFVGLSYIFVPILSLFIFGEQLSTRFFIGVGAIIIGLYLVATSSP